MARLLNREQIHGMFRVLSSKNPEPTTELEYKSTFELLVAVILSAQSTDVGVNKATKSLFAKANTAESIAALGEKTLKKYIQTIGLYNTKAKNIIKTCHILVQEHKGEVPDTRSELELLPGVGRKTANVILNTAFGHETMAVDTHIFRIANRTGLAPAKSVLAVEKRLLQRIPKPWLRHAHHWLILHGRYVCTSRSPKCQQCDIKQFCNFTGKNT